MCRRLIRLAALVAVAATIVWLTRERMLPTPRVPEEPPPHYRSTPPPPEPVGDNLTLIKGIGPVYAGRLSDAGITTFDGLAAASTDAVMAATGVSSGSAAGWIEQASDRTT